MPELASVNGQISAIADAKISINDRAFVFGDAVYEVIVAYAGTLFLFNEHLARLRRSLDFVRMDYVPIEPIADEICRAFDAAAMPRAKVYVQITRGVAPRNHPFPTPRVRPNVVVTVREFPLPNEAWFADGVACATCPDIRWGRVDIKTVNLLPNCLAKQDSMDRGFEDAILIGPDGLAREATAANLFLVRAGALWTHPADEHILPGITRSFLLDLARQNGIEVIERGATVAELLGADEVFLSGTTAEVLPVVRVDTRAIADGRPGPISRRLLKIFRDWVAAQGR